jgi:triosephosphate isomerase
MFKTVRQAVSYVRDLGTEVQALSGADIALAPPFTAVHAAAGAARGANISIAVQDLHWEREGAFTGEVSAPMAREAGADMAIVGHSERRTLFGETDATVNRKVRAAITAGLRPIVCIGETLDQRDRDETLAVLDRQIKEGLDGVTGDELAGMAIAYEPVWAIGTGRNATPEQAGDAHRHIRQRLKQWFGLEASERCRVLYGGSVKPDNIVALASHADVDGALVGGASLDVRSFVEIIRGVHRAKGLSRGLVP